MCDMSFILVPKHGDDIQIDAWNWHPTLEFLRAEKIIDAQTCELMGLNGCGAKADADLALRIALAIDRKLQGMHPGDRIRADLSTTSEPKKVVHFESSDPIDAVDLYSATYEWLVDFRSFCERSGGFEVL
jgi:hypothetical protein